MKINKKAEVDLKNVLITLCFIIFIATLLGIMITDLFEQNNTPTNNDQALIYLNSIGYTINNETNTSVMLEGYSDTIFKTKNSDQNTVWSFIDFMWNGVWNVLKLTVGLPLLVTKFFTATMVAIGIEKNSGLYNAVAVFISSIMIILVVFFIIYIVGGRRPYN